jgi:hypothetical protein
MKSNPKTSDEYTRFADALEKVLKVSPAELKARIEANKKMRARKSKTSASRVSRAKG